MPMPEAAIDKDCLSTSGEHNIWRAWKILSMEPISKTHSEEERTDRQFRGRVLRRNGSHEATSAFRTQPIRHVSVSNGLIRYGHRMQSTFSI